MSPHNSRSHWLLPGLAALVMLGLVFLIADAIQAEDPLRDVAPAEPEEEQETLPAPQIQFRFLLFPSVLKTGVERTMTLCMVNRGGTNTLELASDDHVALSLPVGPDDEHIADMVGAQDLQCGTEPAGWACSVSLGPGEATVTFEPDAAQVVVTAGETVCFLLEEMTISSVEGLVFAEMTQDIRPNAAMAPENTLLGVFKSEDGVVEHDDLAEVLANQHHVQTWDVSGNDIHTLFGGNVGIGTSNPQRKLHVVGGVQATGSFRSGSTTEYGDGFISFSPAGQDLDIDNGALFVDTGNNRVGINTTNPSSRLHIRSSQFPRIRMTATDPDPDVNMFIDARSAPPEGAPNDPPINRGQIGTLSNHDVTLFTNGFPRMTIDSTGGVGIGNMFNQNDVPAGYALAVDGRVLCEEVEVLISSDWPDYVFDADYPLMPLEELERSILENRRLPGMPTAAEVQSEGLAVGSVQARLLEKVEELTLYMIELRKDLESVKAENARLRQHLDPAREN